MLNKNVKMMEVPVRRLEIAPNQTGAWAPMTWKQQRHHKLARNLLELQTLFGPMQNDLAFDQAISEVLAFIFLT